MIMHIGENISLLGQDIVAIIDINTALESESTREFIDNLIKNDCLVNTLEKNIKTYIIAADDVAHNKKNPDKYKLYVSSISSKSLLGRIDKTRKDWRNVNG